VKIGDELNVCSWPHARVQPQNHRKRKRELKPYHLRAPADEEENRGKTAEYVSFQPAALADNHDAIDAETRAKRRRSAGIVPRQEYAA
jgi:hypothetical protein